MREIIAKRIVAVARNGEGDPAHLHQQALLALGIEAASMLVNSVGSDIPVPAYASVTLQPA